MFGFLSLSPYNTAAKLIINQKQSWCSGLLLYVNLISHKWVQHVFMRLAFFFDKIHLLVKYFSAGHFQKLFSSTIISLRLTSFLFYVGKLSDQSRMRFKLALNFW